MDLHNPEKKEFDAFGEPMDFLNEQAAGMLLEGMRYARLGGGHVPERGKGTNHDRFMYRLAGILGACDILLSRGYFTRAELEQSRKEFWAEMQQEYGLQQMIPPAPDSD
jgi:hypothetical protein